MTYTPNTIVYAEDWAERLQQELDEPTIYKEIATVDISDRRVFHNPYFTDPSVLTGTRGSPYTMKAVTETDESVTVNTYKTIPQFIDRADLAQSRYSNQMQLAERQGVLLNESIETAIYADHANMTDFGTSDIGGGGSSTDQITVSATNVDDIARNIKKAIIANEGLSMLNRNGGFFVWRPADFEKLEQFMMANGFNMADRALENGAARGVRYMGFDHYTSNLLASNHVIAGVKKAPWVGILRSTFGQVMVNDKDPQNYSGISVVTRVDFQEKVWTKVKPVIFDVNVA